MATQCLRRVSFRRSALLWELYGTYDERRKEGSREPGMFDDECEGVARPKLRGFDRDERLRYELEILGSHGMQAHRYTELLAMIRAGELRPDLLVGSTISLEDVLVELPEMNNFTGAGVTVIDRF